MNLQTSNNKTKFQNWPKNYIKHGRYGRRSDGKKEQRYLCKDTGYTFSNSTFSEKKYLKKRHLTYKIAKNYAESQGVNALARSFKISPNTVVKHIEIFHKKAIQYQKNLLESKRKFTDIQFDEMETFHHTKLKPLHISLVVEKESRLILGSVVSVAPYGYKKDLAQKKYGLRTDNRREKTRGLFESLCPFISEKSNFQSDMCTWYKGLVKEIFPDVCHTQYKGRKPIPYGMDELKKGQYDPLFSLNHTCAMHRARVNRLIRKSWFTTKRPDRLQQHLDIYTMFHNMRIIEKREKLSA